MTKKLNKKELIKILVDTYGYEEDDIKLLTNAKLEGMIKQEEKDAELLEVEDTIEVIAKESKIKDDDKILVMSGLSGTLVHHSKSTGRTWEFKEFGQTEKLPYSELLTIRYQNPKVFNEGWLVILNKQIQEDFQLTEIYKNIITPQNINSIFDKSVAEISIFVDALPDGMKVTFVNKARELYKSRKINKLDVVEYVQNKFNISLDDNAPLNDVV